MHGQLTILILHFALRASGGKKLTNKSAAAGVDNPTAITYFGFRYVFKRLWKCHARLSCLFDIGYMPTLVQLRSEINTVLICRVL